ncbi:transglutaminase-like protein [Sarcoptes scabiei]|uniref:protein-glutamine gamma-glutamyltransferase n=1 Tax=Sarcoptes scabiei TaxID=52283 RepID=A0A132A783_SARSC|nr:transglutaminase-like protein [Sarcoptes scabiei]
MAKKDEPNPNYSNKTEIIVPILDERNARRLSILADHQWNARIVSLENRTMIVEINTASDAIIGEYRMVIDTRSPNRIDDSYFSNPISQSFYILFNPWNRNDSVYLKDRNARDEYILNDQGIVWRGTHDQMKPTHWNYAQFEEDVLEACIFAISNVGVFEPADRNDPIKLSRHIVTIVNSVDDKGIVEGNWDDNFSGGTAPTDWHGSQAILKKFLQTKKSVKFGQCWVFSGVTCTICRCIGLPCRVVTNYMSAHDTNKSLTVDRFFDENGDPLEKLNKDSIWNFHSWNEVWMTRPDLSVSGAYDGWNLIDATPQEPSDNLYRVGPTSVEAIKFGEVTKPYDGFFVYAEVNADEVYWLHKGEKKPLKLITQLTESIGVKIVTKAMFKNHTVDITQNYKHKESSKAERESMIKALKLTKSNFSRYYLNEKFEDIRFELVPLESKLIGEPFKYYVIDDFRLRLPDIEINIEGDAIVDETFTCQLSFQNPLPKPLTRGKFTVEGPDYSNRVVANLHR